MRAWHFVGATLRDGSPIPADGELLKFNDRPIMCEQGLHASLDPFDALQYAPGGNLCLVECGGTILHQSDKLVCTERTIIARMDATDMLRYFARMQAVSALRYWDTDPPEVVLDYLMTGDESIRDAAWAATWAATWAAARDAAWAAAWAAARAAAWAAARDAAWAAARDAAWAAARAAAWAAARSDFNWLVVECFRDYLP